MNIIEIQDSLKDLPDSALMQEMQAPSGSAPQFLVLSELKRRKRMRDDFQRRQNADMKTVAEEVVTAAGAPQEGIMQMSRAMAPNSSIAQNTGMDMAAPVQPTQAPQMMADGGIMKLQRGGAISAQPTGQGGTYILVQDGQQVPGTGTYPDFRSANEAAKAIRDVPVFQRSRVLSDLGQPEPILETEVSALSQVDPDAMAFSANDEMRRQLQLRQARGQRDDPSVDGIASLDPLGRAFMDEYRPDMSVASSQEGIPEFGDAPYAQTNLANLLETMTKANEGIAREGLPASADDDLRFSRGTASTDAVKDALTDYRRTTDEKGYPFDSTLRSADRLFDAGTPSVNAPNIDFDAVDPSIGTRPRTAADFAGVDIGADANTVAEMNKILDLAGIGPSTSSDVDMIDLMGQAADERGGYEAFAKLDAGVEPPLNVLGLGGQGDETKDSTVTRRTGRTDSISDGSFSLSDLFPDFTTTGAGRGRSGTDATETEDVTTPSEQAEQVAAALSLPVTTSGIEEFVEQEKLRGFGTPAVDGDGGGDGGGDKPTPPTTPRGGANFGSIESRIAQMLEDREKSAEADKWMALAQTGMALMASKNPTFGGALGEAGLLGVGAMQKARKQYDDDILGLLGMQQKVQTAKAAATKAGSSTKGLNQEIDDARAYLNGLNTEARSYRKVVSGDPTMGTEDRFLDMTPPDLKAEIIAAQDRLNKLMELRSSLGTSTFDATK